MRAADVCKIPAICAKRDATLTEIARLMRENHVGCVVIVDDAPRPVGIVTDRDIVVEVVATGVDHRGIAAGEIMTTPLVVADADEDALGALRIMRLRGIRRLPVVDKDGFLIGITTLDDLLDIAGDAFYDIVGAINSERSLESWRRP